MSQPTTAIKSVSVTFVNGQSVSFEDDAGLPLGRVKTVHSLLQEEIKAVLPPRTSRVKAAA